MATVDCGQLEDEPEPRFRPWRWPRHGQEAEEIDAVDLAVCPPSCYLDAVGRAIAGSKVALGAQNMYHERTGPLPAN